MKPLPEQLLQELEGVPGFDKAAFVLAHEQPSPVSIRLNPSKETAAIPFYKHIPWCAGGRYLERRPVFTLDPLYHAGAYYVQEPSSMVLDYLLRKLLPERKGLRVLDLCAAPGGKSTLLASLLDPASLLISNDVIRSRATILEENIVRWGHTNNWVTSNDPKDFGRLKGYFDVIVVDAPCSGSGLFRKDPKALDEWSEANVQLCGQRQQRILADVWPSLKEDGLLVYATCSYSPGEDEAILDWVAETFEVETLDASPEPGWSIVETLSSGKQMKGYRFFPDKLRGEGFFISAFRKNEAAGNIKEPRFRSGHNQQAWQQSRYFLKDQPMICLPGQNGSFNAIHPVHEADIKILSGMVYLRKTGLNLGNPAGKDWIPSHEVALSIDRSALLPTIEVDREQALRFLKKEDFMIAPPPRGWYLVAYQGLSLGWIKSLGNRINNYLPKQWRIRMELPDEDWA